MIFYTSFTMQYDIFFYGKNLYKLPCISYMNYIFNLNILKKIIKKIYIYIKNKVHE